MRLGPVHALIAVTLFAAPEPGSAQGLSGSPRPAPLLLLSEIHREGNPAAPDLPDDLSLPADMLDLVRKADLHYLEGAALLKSGETSRARQEFDAAVDLFLKSGHDLGSHTTLHRFFQDLIRRIQQDESRYLPPAAVVEENAEPAVHDELERLDLYPITVDPALVDVVETDLTETRYDVPVVLNEPVLQSLNYWLTRGRKYFTEGLVRSGRYREMIETTFREESIPLDLMYLAQVESLFKTQALSRAKAKGIWQFARDTAIRYGLRVDAYIDERSDPEKSTRAAARYLSDLYGMFRDWNLALAAYNWGEARVQRLVNQTGLNDFWSLLDRRRSFPRETRNHIPLIMASIILARNPQRYDLPEELDEPLRHDRVTVPRPIELAAAARLLDIPLEDLKRLNPALKGSTTPPNYPDFELKIPKETDPKLHAKLAALPVVKPRAVPDFSGRYRVKPGDTLSRIASLHRVSLAELQRANNITNPRTLRAGAWIHIPARTASSSRRGTAAAAAGGRSSKPPARSVPKSTAAGRATDN